MGNELDVMQDITNYNTDRMCVEEYCSHIYTHFTLLRLRGMVVVLSFCDEHAEEWELKEEKSGSNDG